MVTASSNGLFGQHNQPPSDWGQPEGGSSTSVLEFPLNRFPLNLETDREEQGGFELAFSMGFSWLEPQHPQSLGQPVELADVEVYRDKLRPQESG